MTVDFQVLGGKPNTYFRISSGDTLKNRNLIHGYLENILEQYATVWLQYGMERDISFYKSVFTPHSMFVM